MAHTLEILSHRTETLTSIRGIVHTMKTLSAINASPYEHAAQAIEAYHRTVLEGFSAFLHRNGALELASKASPKKVVVVFGSDHGLCGGYNETLATEVSKYLETHGPEKSAAYVLCVGARMDDALTAQGVLTGQTLLPPASADGIGRLAGVLATRIEDIARQSRPDELAVTLAFTERAAEGLQEPVLRNLLPLDPKLIAGLLDRPWVSRSLPEFTLPAKDLLAELIIGHLFASLFRASAEAMVTENAARLSLMQQAEQSIDDRLEELKSEARTVRQTEITTELLDVIAGFEALSGRRSS
jgi:F-type H+-transporting ATPase subunit gamma